MRTIKSRGILVSIVLLTSIFFVSCIARRKRDLVISFLQENKLAWETDSLGRLGNRAVIFNKLEHSYSLNGLKWNRVKDYFYLPFQSFHSFDYNHIQCSEYWYIIKLDTIDPSAYGSRYSDYLIIYVDKQNSLIIGTRKRNPD